MPERGQPPPLGWFRKALQKWGQEANLGNSKCQGERAKGSSGKGCFRAHLPSTCCCSSCTLWQISPATMHVFPTLVNRAAILSLRRKPAARRLS